ncbi:MAG: TIR domain-containing protein [Maribacter sp.]|uniref:TIR domain-containing protein n=1 Tax=Maribacter sp. TaxID=1897614 RepID=UPI00329749DE
MAAQLTIFTIYTSEDKEILLHLLNHLKPFEKEFDVSFWHDDAIHSGQFWKPQIESRLHEADIFLLLVSNTFMYSEFVKQLEFKMVIDRYKEGKATVIPVLIDYCQWEIEFQSDDYDFSLNELQVLPEDAKPIKTWDSPNQAYANIAVNIKGVIKSLLGETTQEESEIQEAAQQTIDSAEEQIALSFNEEEEENEEALRLQEEIKAKKIAEEQRRLKEEAAKTKAEEEKKLQEAQETQRRQEEEKRLREAAERQSSSEQQRRLGEEAQTKSVIDPVNQDEKKGKEQPVIIKVKERVEKAWNGYASKNVKRILAALLLVALATWAIRSCSKTNRAPDKPTDTTPIADTILGKDATAKEELDIDLTEKEEVLIELAVGDTYEDGYVFEIAADGKTGKIAHIDDVGPMTWKNAMSIHDQLGSGWRLPTFDELLLMQKTIGQGASNKGEFSDGLYWSATDFDEYQARLLRFRDANRSYHYNKEAEHRKFRVRAIRDFRR